MPKAKMRPPAIMEERPEALTEQRLTKLLKACEGPPWENRLDTAVVRPFVDTRMR